MDNWNLCSKLEETKNKKQSYIIFTVKNEIIKSDILFQLPVTTYQAYNFWGGKSLYKFSSGDKIPWGTAEGRKASKVSFNRPYACSVNSEATYGMGAGEFFTNLQPKPISSAGWDYNMVRWLEKKGYSVSYITNIDTHNSGEMLTNHTIFLSSGHDEYWTMEMRNNVINSRDNGTHLAFFAANIAYWQIRLEPSSNTLFKDRTLVCYKSKNSDPIKGQTATINFRDPILSKPESEFIGVQYFAYRIDSDITITNASHPIFKNINLKNGDKLKGLLGYEVDGITKFSPSNITVLSKSKASYLKPNDMPLKSILKAYAISLPLWLLLIVFLAILLFLFWFYKKVFSKKIARFFMSTSLVLAIGLFIGLYIFQEKNTANMTIYTSESGATVFATGTIQWSWGLDDYNVPELRSSRYDEKVEIITENVFEYMGVKKLTN